MLAENRELALTVSSLNDELRSMKREANPEAVIVLEKELNAARSELEQAKRSLIQYIESTNELEKLLKAGLPASSTEGKLLEVEN